METITIIETGSQHLREPLDFYHVSFTFLLSFLAWPAMYALDNGFSGLDESVRPVFILLAGVPLFIGILLLVKYSTKCSDWIYRVITLFSFTCMIDTTLVLENNGKISNFMSNYRNFGEQYVKSPWGNAACAFDAYGFFSMYLLWAFLISNGKCWRSLGIYYVAAVMDAMVVLVSGLFIGNHKTTICSCFNLPYIIFPICVLIRICKNESRGEWKIEIERTKLINFFDVGLAMGLIASIWICISKGLAAFSPITATEPWILKHEPAILFNDPTPFTAIQMFIYLFYIVPIQGISLFYVFRNKKPGFLWDLGLVHAGIMLQSQLQHVHAICLDPQVPKGIRSEMNDPVFWVVNILILLVPQLYLYRLYLQRSFSGKK